MPILIRLKTPAINIIANEEIKVDDESVKMWDTLFNQGVMITKSPKGHHLLIPLWSECNIAFMQNVTQKELDEQRKRAEEEAKRRGDPRGSSLIDTPGFAFPGGSKRGQ